MVREAEPSWPQQHSLFSSLIGTHQNRLCVLYARLRPLLLLLLPSILTRGGRKKIVRQERFSYEEEGEENTLGFMAMPISEREREREWLRGHRHLTRTNTKHFSLSTLFSHELRLRKKREEHVTMWFDFLLPARVSRFPLLFSLEEAPRAQRWNIDGSK